VSISWVRDRWPAGKRAGTRRRLPRPPRSEEAAGPAPSSQPAELEGRYRASLKFIADHSAAVDPANIENGRKLADSLRLEFPGLPDVVLARMLLVVWDLACEAADLAPEPGAAGMPFTVLSNAVAFAAVDLTALDRMSHPL